MKKIVMAIAALALVAAMIIPVSAAEAPAPVDYNTETSTTSCSLGTPLMVFSLEEIDRMAIEAGYTLVEPVAGDAIRTHTARVENVTYNVTLHEQMVTKCSHQDDSEIGGAIYAMPLCAGGELVTTEFDPKSALFDDVVSMGTVKAKLVEAGYAIDESAPVTHYWKGNDAEGSSVTVIGNTVRVYNYGDNYGELVEYVIANNTVPVAILAIVG